MSSPFHSIECKRIAGTAICQGIRQRKVHHSPTGFEWGYMGSGPADLALNILAAALPGAMGTDGVQLNDRRTRVNRRAFELHQSFKRDVVGRMPSAGFRLSRADVERWLDGTEATRADIGRELVEREHQRMQPSAVAS